MCEQAPANMGNFTLMSGLCLAGTPIDPTIAPGFAPPLGRKVTNVGACGRYCDEFPSCTNFTFHTDTTYCNLFTNGDGATQNYTCLSGGSNGHSWPLPCRSNMDCSGHGTCSGGSCNCTDGFTSKNCDLAPPSCGSCNLRPGICMKPTGDKATLFKNSSGWSVVLK